MKQILLFGAGKSATVLIDYLLINTAKENWNLVVVDADLKLAASKIKDAAHAIAFSFDINDETARNTHIRNADIIISLLPPSLHILVAKSCINEKKNLLTASYIDTEIKKLQPEIEKNNLLFLCEMGLDPGIDHMSAMKMIDDIRSKGGEITSFYSHCGGLVAPENDDNPWHYKISWSPRNIVLAGKSGAHFKENGEEKFLPYEKLFDTERLAEVPGLGILGWYPNRDSVSYSKLYALENAQTFIRTTLRHPDFMYGWKNVVYLKLTDETPQYKTNNRSLFEIFKEHMYKHGFSNWLHQNLKTREAAILSPKMHESNLILKQLFFLGLDDTQTKINKGICSAADVMQFAMEKKLVLKPDDKDMIAMMHELKYRVGSRESLACLPVRQVRSTLIVKGEDALRTAMAKTVGLPLGIAAKNILNGKIKLTGLHIPVVKEIYEPVLKELEEYDIKFTEESTLS